MPVHPIVFFPDPRLRQIAAPVSKFDAPLRNLAADLLDTLRAAPGIGITAPHIGIALRVVVLDLPDTAAPQIYINPKIIWRSETTEQHDEGSISMPGISAPVMRPAAIKVQYADLEGHIHTDEASGLRSVCLQHEIDQLDGVFWLQTLSSLRRNRLIARYKKLQRG